MINYDKPNHPVTSRADFLKHHLQSAYPEVSLEKLPVTSPGITAALDNGIQPFLNDLEFKGLRRPIVLHGPTGTGKTLLTSALWNHIGLWIPDRTDLKSANSAGTADNLAWYRGDELPELWKSGNPAMNQSNLQVANHQSSCLLMVLDDLDKCPGGGWSARLLGMLDCRLKNPELITIATMNRTPSEFAQKHDKAGDLSGTAIMDRFRRRGAIFICLNERAQPTQPQEALIG